MKIDLTSRDIHGTMFAYNQRELSQADISAGPKHIFGAFGQGCSSVWPQVGRAQVFSLWLAAVLLEVKMQNASGGELKATVSFRLPVSEYQKFMDMAQRRSVKLSEVMRDIARQGLAVIEQRQQSEPGDFVGE